VPQTAHSDDFWKERKTSAVVANSFGSIEARCVHLAINSIIVEKQITEMSLPLVIAHGAGRAVLLILRRWHRVTAGIDSVDTQR
jgi:hypothetical protein